MAPNNTDTSDDSGNNTDLSLDPPVLEVEHNTDLFLISADGGTFDASAFARELDANAESSSQGLCGRYLSWALDAGGDELGSQNGGSYGPLLLASGWVSVSPDGYTPQIGDIIVYSPSDDHQYGHIEGYDGSQWVSDFTQNSDNPYRDPSTAGTRTIYRYGG